MTAKPKTVLAFGTYDVFHPGHEYFLREAKKHGTRLVVVVARDNNVERIKGKRPHDTEATRLANVATYFAVDEARLGYEKWGEHLQVLEDIAPDVICLGYDQRAQLPEGGWQVVRVDAYMPERYKSSFIRP
ncbi:MAG: adenylyltransferase/cytidyltransferase family protein [Candidatus Kerfeldbacteria bacterium]|nr:adenylyltransferase/cytidyltransferase family protein [Candidatus Kerfeldbacteria bacterium]